MAALHWVRSSPFYRGGSERFSDWSKVTEQVSSRGHTQSSLCLQGGHYLGCSVCGTSGPYQLLLHPCLLWSKAHRLRARKREKVPVPFSFPFRRTSSALGIFDFMDVACQRHSFLPPASPECLLWDPHGSPGRLHLCSWG